MEPWVDSGDAGLSHRWEEKEKDRMLSECVEADERMDVRVDSGDGLRVILIATSQVGLLLSFK